MFCHVSFTFYILYECISLALLHFVYSIYLYFYVCINNNSIPFKMFKIFLFFVNKISFKSAQMYIKPRHIILIKFGLLFVYFYFRTQKCSLLRRSMVYFLLDMFYCFIFEWSLQYVFSYCYLWLKFKFGKTIRESYFVKYTNSSFIDSNWFQFLLFG